MSTMKPFGVAALALGLALFSPAFAATEHAHGSPGRAALELTLNNGQKWPTDEALRRAMGEMRGLLATSIGRIHASQFTSADYVALADRLQEQIDYVTANCKLPEEADAQLHIVLAEPRGDRQRRKRASRSCAAGSSSRSRAICSSSAT